MRLEDIGLAQRDDPIAHHRRPKQCIDTNRLVEIGVLLEQSSPSASRRLPKRAARNEERRAVPTVLLYI